MQIHGLNKTTLLDYPEHVAATVFTGGCNFCCPFCHNGDLVLHPGEFPVISEEEVIAFLKREKYTFRRMYYGRRTHPAAGSGGFYP